MKNENQKIEIYISDWDIEKLKTGGTVHWATRINGKLYRIEGSQKV